MKDLIGHSWCGQPTPPQPPLLVLTDKKCQGERAVWLWVRLCRGSYACLRLLRRAERRAALMSDPPGNPASPFWTCDGEKGSG